MAKVKSNVASPPSGTHLQPPASTDSKQSLMNIPRAPAKGTEMHFEIIEVSPQLALKWLATNDNEQRNLRKSTVEQYARDMREGRWTLTHQPIAFNEHGKLVDGQHRLNAVVDSGVTLRFAVVVQEGLTVHDPIDRGAKRTIADLLGKGWDQLRVAAAGTLYALQTGDVLIRHQRTKDEVALAYECAQEDFDAVSRNLTHRRNIVTSGVFAALVFARPLNPDKVDAFTARLETGEGLAMGDNALALRNWIIGAKGRRAKYTAIEYAIATCGPLHYEILGKARTGTLKTAVHIAPTGYRWLCSRRRGTEVPNTPPASVVRAPGDEGGIQGRDATNGGRGLRNLRNIIPKDEE